MGGTSTDVALVHDRSPRINHANQIDAYALQAPQLDIHTIGAGGGSIVRVQPDGTLEVGPQSAGAVAGGRPAISAAAPSPPFPTPTSCSGAFRPIAR